MKHWGVVLKQSGADWVIIAVQPLEPAQEFAITWTIGMGDPEVLVSTYKCIVMLCEQEPTLLDVLSLDLS